MVSTKKSDLMPIMSTSDAGLTYVPEAVAMSTNNCSVYLITGRERADLGSDLTAARGSNEVYWKGFSDNLLIQSTTSDPWKWRRIVFELQGGPTATGLTELYYMGRIGLDVAPVQPPESGGPGIKQIEPLQGLWRYARNFNFLPNNLMVAFLSGLFGGNAGFDRNYGQFLTARLDNKTIKIHYDKTRSINSGNDSGVLKNYKLYHPINKSMTYSHTEVGSMDTTSSYAAPASPLGDVYVVDLFTQLNDAPGSLRVTGQGKSYWHER